MRRPCAPGRRQARERRGREGAEGLVREGRRVARGALLQQDGRAHQEEEAGVQDDDEPEDPLAVLRSRKQARRVAGEAPDEGDDAGGQDRGGEHVLAEVVDGVEPRRKHLLVQERRAPEGPPEGRQPLQDHLEVAQAEDQEAVEEDPVQQAGRRVLLQPLLAQRVGQHRAGALARVVGEGLVPARARVDEHAEVPQPPGHEAERGEEKTEGQEGLKHGQHHGWTTSGAAKSIKPRDLRRGPLPPRADPTRGDVAHRASRRRHVLLGYETHEIVRPWRCGGPCSRLRGRGPGNGHPGLLGALPGLRSPRARPEPLRARGVRPRRRGVLQLRLGPQRLRAAGGGAGRRRGLRPRPGGPLPGAAHHALQRLSARRGPHRRPRCRVLRRRHRRSGRPSGSASGGGSTAAAPA